MPIEFNSVNYESPSTFDTEVRPLAGVVRAYGQRVAFSPRLSGEAKSVVIVRISWGGLTEDQKLGLKTLYNALQVQYYLMAWEHIALYRSNGTEILSFQVTTQPGSRFNADPMQGYTYDSVSAVVGPEVWNVSFTLLSEPMEMIA